MTLTSTKVGTFVDTSVAVPNLKDAVAFWTTTMGFEHVADTEGNTVPWSIVRDPETDQRINLIESDYVPFALSFETDDVDGSASSLTDAGCTLQDSGMNEANGFQWAVVRDTSGLPILLGSVSEADSPHGERGTTQNVAGRFSKVTETMLRVQSMQKAVDFWSQSLGFEIIDQADDYTILVDRQSGQRVTLLEGLATDWAFSVETTQLDSIVENLEAAGGVVRHRESLPSGFAYAMVCVADIYPLCVWSTAGASA